MRALSAMVLFCVLALGMSGRLTAGDEINVPNAQLLIDAARNATPGVFTDVTLNLNGKTVVFALFRDAVGNVTAKPKVGQDTTGITTTQVNIQMASNSSGILTPISMVVQGGNGLTKYMVNFTANTTTVATLTQPTGGIGGTQDANRNQPAPPDPFANPFLSVSTGGQLPLPAGAESGKISVWQP